MAIQTVEVGSWYLLDGSLVQVTAVKPRNGDLLLGTVEGNWYFDYDGGYFLERATLHIF